MPARTLFCRNRFYQRPIRIVGQVKHGYFSGQARRRVVERQYCLPGGFEKGVARLKKAV